MVSIATEMIESEHLLMRPLSIKDARDMFAFTSIPESSAFLKWEPHTNPDQDELFIKKALKDDKSLYWGIQHKEMGKLIGNIHVYDIHVADLRAEVSYILHPSFCGNGLATEAVSAVVKCLLEQGLYRVQALCLEGHERSEKLMFRCGMTYEGTLRNYAWVKGKKYNMKMYAICRED